jgi:hypothetical protein
MPEKKDFVVKDRRIFSGEAQDSKEKEDVKAPPKEEAKEEVPPEGAASQETARDFKMPKITFATFIFSLNTSVLMHLGLIEDPATGEKSVNLPIAKQTIDILGMMEEKTRGNLSKDEESMLKNILYDLRILYVKEKR